MQGRCIVLFLASTQTTVWRVLGGEINRHHATVIHAVKTIENEMIYSQVYEDYTKIREKIEKKLPEIVVNYVNLLKLCK